MRIATLFGAFDSEDMPAPAHERHSLDDAEREAVLRFLSGGTIAARTSGRTIDRIDASRGKVVPVSFATDGTWMWSRAVAYYLREHNVVPEPAFLAHIRECGYTASQPGQAELSVAVRMLRSAERDNDL
ncbi:hypothetical protein C8258_30400 [Nocardia sp. MDA0666]|nr:hypothetical protein C8258_30400 [Nocardia sp. MDA0666]